MTNAFLCFLGQPRRAQIQCHLPYYKFLSQTWTSTVPIPWRAVATRPKSSANPSLTNPGTTKSRLRKFRGAKVQTQKNIEQNYNFFFKPFQHCTFAPSKFSQSTSVVLGLLIVKIHTICPPPCPLKTMRVSRCRLAQLCDWKANIVWWGCGGGSTSRSSTSSDQ